MMTATRPQRLAITDRKTGDEFSSALTKKQVCNELRFFYGGTLNTSRLFKRMVTDADIDVIETTRERVMINLAQLLNLYPKLRITVLRDRRYGTA